MFKYYQTGERTIWKAISDSQDVESRALSKGAKKVTILAVSEVIDDEETDKNNLSYKGPFYGDIDNKSIAEAIASAREMIENLRAIEVPDPAIQLYASGGKGFHVIVPASVFSTGRPLKNLPAIYREMALDLHVIGLDFQVYSASRGVCWRLPNIERENGKYRVPVTIDEVMNMTPEGYADITSRARIIPIPSVEGLSSVGMTALMEQAKRRVKMRPKPAKLVPDSDLVQFREAPPACVHSLADYKVRTSANFNESGLQMGIYLARSGTGGQMAASLMSRMAENSHSTKYYTPRQRLNHLQGLVSYLEVTGNKGFSCPAMRSLVTADPCQNCPLTTKDAQFEEGDLHSEVDVAENFDGYYVSEKKISTFTMKATDVYMEASLDGVITRRMAAKVDVCRDDSPIDEIILQEDSWNSNHKFKAALEGLSGAVFWGSSEDVQKIKYLVCSETMDMNQIIQTHAAGIHQQRIGNRNINVYVEPGFSINEIRMKGTHEMLGSLSNPPTLQSASVPDKGDPELDQLMRWAFDVNSALTVGQIIGWLAACHLKTHFMVRHHEFPLLNMWGNAGSGKSMTSILLAGLGGCDYTAPGNAPKTMASITQWSLIDLTSRTTTIPRILEEYNKSKIEPRMYNFIGEIMKAAFNGQAIARGRLTRSNANKSGTEVIEYPILGPLMIISEQAIQMPALQQRCVQVCMSHHDRKGKTRQYEAAKRRQGRLLDLALALMIKSLSTRDEWIDERMAYWEPRVDEKLIERPRYSYKVILTGLDFLKLVMEELELQSSELIPALQAEVCKVVRVKASNMSAERHRTEIDAVMESMATMAAMTANGGTDWLLEGKHYIKKDGFLYLDLQLAHPLYTMYCKYIGTKPVIENPRMMLDLLIQEFYFETNTAVCEELKLNRTVAKLSLAKMMEKGIVVSMF